MGANMVGRLLKDGHQCGVYDLDSAHVEPLVQAGASGAGSLAELAEALSAPRAIWGMVPAGAATDHTVSELAECLEADDTVIDGGNTYFERRRASVQTLEKAGHPLRRRWDQRGSLGCRPWLLHDGRR